MVLFSLSTFVLFHFALDESEVDGGLAVGDPVGDAAVRRRSWGSTGCSWPSARRAASTASCSRPVDRTALFVAKATVLFAFLAAVEVFVVAAFAILLLGPVAVAGAAGLVAGAGCWPTSAWRSSGRWSRALAVQTRARDLLVPLLALPAVGPAGDRRRARQRRRCSPQDGAGALEARWLLILGLYDLVFGLLAYAIFDFLLEE